MKNRRRLIDADTLVLLKQIGIGLLVIGVVALVFSAIWYGTRLSVLTISSVHIEGGETVRHDIVREKVEGRLEGTYLGLIPKRFAWLYPKEEITETVNSIERLHNVKVVRKRRTEIFVTFDEYRPRALWCKSVEGEECLFVDTTGYAFGSAPKLSGGSFLRFVKNGEEAEVGNQLASQAEFDSLLMLADLLAGHDWYVSHIELDQVGDVFIKIVGGGELKVVASESPEKTLENLLTVLASEDFSHIKPGNFQYIDLRFGNKVFVNEEIAVPEEETAIESASSTIEDITLDN
ncbi:hypothetical protein KC850_00695 [Candidatus Kaiserbacteria bacterium]|nr:hypothetical protein [Candidatus Kaiserbacteria bacterium]